MSVHLAEYFIDILEFLEQVYDVEEFYMRVCNLRDLILENDPTYKENYFVACFIQDLKPTIADYVHNCVPHTLSSAYEFASPKETELNNHSSSLVVVEDVASEEPHTEKEASYITWPFCKTVAASFLCLVIQTTFVIIPVDFLDTKGTGVFAANLQDSVTISRLGVSTVRQMYQLVALSIQVSNKEDSSIKAAIQHDYTISKVSSASLSFEFQDAAVLVLSHGVEPRCCGVDKIEVLEVLTINETDGLPFCSALVSVSCIAIHGVIVKRKLSQGDVVTTEWDYYDNGAPVTFNVESRVFLVHQEHRGSLIDAVYEQSLDVTLRECFQDFWGFNVYSVQNRRGLNIWCFGPGIAHYQIASNVYVGCTVGTAFRITREYKFTFWLSGPKGTFVAQELDVAKTMHELLRAEISSRPSVADYFNDSVRHDIIYVDKIPSVPVAVVSLASISSENASLVEKSADYQFCASVAVPEELSKEGTVTKAALTHIISSDQVKLAPYQIGKVLSTTILFRHQFAQMPNVATPHKAMSVDSGFIYETIVAAIAYEPTKKTSIVGQEDPQDGRHLLKPLMMLKIPELQSFLSRFAHVLLSVKPLIVSSSSFTGVVSVSPNLFGLYGAAIQKENVASVIFPSKKHMSTAVHSKLQQYMVVAHGFNASHAYKALTCMPLETSVGRANFFFKNTAFLTHLVQKNDTTKLILLYSVQHEFYAKEADRGGTIYVLILAEGLFYVLLCVRAKGLIHSGEFLNILIAVPGDLLSYGVSFSLGLFDIFLKEHLFPNQHEDMPTGSSYDLESNEAIHFVGDVEVSMDLKASVEDVSRGDVVNAST